MMKDPTKVKEMEDQVKKRIEEGEKQLEEMNKVAESEVKSETAEGDDSKPSAIN
jgi:hypothetical protein